MEWYRKAASHGSIAAPFSYLDRQLKSAGRTSIFCEDYEEVLRLSARVQNIYGYLFLSSYHSGGVCKAPNMVKNAYYMHLAASLDRAFGENRDRLVGQLSEEQLQRLDRLLRQKVTPISESEFLTHFVKTVRR